MPLIYHHLSLKEETKKSSQITQIINLTWHYSYTRTYLENTMAGRKQLSKEIKCHKFTYIYD